MDRGEAARLTLARLLRDLREHAGLTQQDVADALGTSQATISKIETGERKLDLIELRQYGNAVGSDLQYIIAKFEGEL